MRRTHTLPLAIFLLMGGLYLLTMSGHTYSPDEETMLAVTRSLLARGDVAVVADGAPVSALRPGLNGERYSPYGVLPSLLALPLHLLGAFLGGADPGARDYTSRFAVTALNGLLTAATAAVLAAWALRLGASRWWAVGLALLYGLATFAWPYARTFFSEPLAGLLIILAAYQAWVAGERLTTGGRATGPLLVSGLAAGLLLPTRIAAGVALPIIGFYVLWVIWQSARRPDAGLRAGGNGQAVSRNALPAGGNGPQADGNEPLPGGAGRPSAFCILHSAFWLPGCALLLWYNLARFGTPFASGYASESSLFTTPMAEGLYGLLLSPGKSVLLFAPPLLVALPGGVALWRRGQRGVVLLVVGLFLSHLLLYARWGEWHGGGVWGPRFLLPVVAPLLVLGAGLFAEEHRQGRRRALWAVVPRWSLVVGVAVLGFVGNLGGVLLNFGTYVVAPTDADRISSFAGSPLVGHWRLLADRWARYRTPPPSCRLGDGWFATEDPEGGVLPRRSGARGELWCNTRDGGRVAFILDDRRPPEAPPSELRVTLNGQALVMPSGQLRAYHLLLPPGPALIVIKARTWNPLAVGFSDRNDELGPQLGELRGGTTAGLPVTVVDTAIAPLPVLQRPRWAWYYDPPNQHLVDHWAWYLPRSELTGARAWLLAGSILMLGLASAGTGIRVLHETHTTPGDQ